jgi:Raf kinase inhibitor-like YbhB/YbcL family protein
MRNLTLFFLALTLSSCGSKPAFSTETQEANMTLSLSSSAFTAGASIPVQYSCKGRDVSPPLAWTNSPANTKSFALIMDDPDAPMGTWVHWVLFNIPSGTNSLPEAVAPGGQRPDGSLQGRNSSGNSGYNGPCPPSGTHRYFFKLYALDALLDLSSGADKGRLSKAMEGHILAQGELMGTFSK